MIKLNRNHIFLIGLLVAFLFVGIHILNFELASNSANGEVVGYRDKKCVVAFYVNGEEIRFLSEPNLSYKVHDKVEVIYKINNPKNAAIYDFIGFYLNYFLYSIIPIMLFASFNYAWFDKYDFVIVNWRNRKISKERLPAKL